MARRWQYQSVAEPIVLPGAPSVASTNGPLVAPQSPAVRRRTVGAVYHVADPSFFEPGAIETITLDKWLAAPESSRRRLARLAPLSPPPALDQDLFAAAEDVTQDKWTPQTTPPRKRQFQATAYGSDPFPAAGATADGTFWNFDFGTSDAPVAGWIRVQGGDGVPSVDDYTALRGYGWTASHFNPTTGGGVASRDRGDPLAYPLLRYLCASEYAIFRANVENGDYTVRLISGDANQLHDDCFVWVNDLFREAFSIQEDEWVIKEYSVTVTNGIIYIKLWDGHDYLNLGEDFYCIWTAIQIFPHGANVPAPAVPTPPPPIIPPVPPTSHTNQLLFGPPTTPVAAGWTLIPYTTRYNAALGVGYVPNTFTRDKDRGTGAESVRYFTTSGEMTFRIDVPTPGVYEVVVVFGDATAAHDQEIYIDYLRVDTQSYALNTPVTRTYTVNVYGDHFRLGMFGGGGPSYGDSSYTLHSLVYTLTGASLPAQPYRLKFDFGDHYAPPPNSPLAVGYTRVTAATAYSVGGFGWVSGSTGLEDRDQGYNTDYLLSNDLTRSYCLMTDATFKCTLPNGSYTLTMVSGEVGSGHDFDVYIQGIQYATKSLVAEQFTFDDYAITVTDGTLTVRLVDTAAPTNYALLNALIITAV